MYRWRTLLLAGIAVFVGALAWTLPAQRALDWLQPPLVADSVAGTVTRGHADNVRTHGLQVDTLRWNLRPLSLLLARADYALELEGETLGSGRVVRGLTGSLQVNEVGLLIPASELEPLFADWGLQLGGRVTLDIDHGSLDAENVHIEGRVTWSEARLGGAGGMELGAVVLDLQPDGANTVGALSDVEGPVSLQGELILSADGAWSLEGKLRPRRRMPPDVRSMLGLLGQADAEGRYPLSFSGSL